MADALNYETPPAGPPQGAMLAIVLVVFTDLLGFGVILPQLPFYGRQFGASDWVVTLLFTTYSGCQLLAGPVLGTLSDRVGRRPVLVLSQLGSVLGYAVLGLAVAGHFANPAVGLAMVFLGRVIDGISGGNISTAQAYVSDVSTGEGRAKAMGMLGAAFGVGFAAGPAIGGLLGEIGPVWPAVAAGFFSLVAAGATYFYLPESHRRPALSDGPSDESGRLSAAEPDHETGAARLPWFHPERLREIPHDAAVVQLLAVWFFTMFAFVLADSTFALFLNDQFGFGPGKVGLFFTLAGVIIICVQGGLIGRLTARFGEWPLVILGPGLVACAMVGFALSSASVGFALAMVVLLTADVVNAGGRSLLGPTLSSLLSKAAPRDKQGITFGMYGSLGSLARALGPILAGGLYELSHVAPFLAGAFIAAAVSVWLAVLRWRVPAVAEVDPIPDAAVSA